MRFSCFIPLLAAAGTVLSNDLPLRLVTFNIRSAARSAALHVHEKPWSFRAPFVINQLKITISRALSGAETLIGLQEVLYGQLQDIHNGLGANWSYIGVGRDDGKDSGEFNPIFYRRSALKLLFNETKWLSPMPDTPSFGWNAQDRRIVSLGVFEHVGSGKRFIAANTHLDHVSSEARIMGVKVVLDVIQVVQKRWGPLAVFLTGDFNSPPGKDAYTTMVDSGYLADAYTLVGDSQRLGGNYTFTGFRTNPSDAVKLRIDYIWLGPVACKCSRAVRYEVLTNCWKKAILSDHRAVVGDVIVE